MSEENGEALPPGWEFQRLGDIAEINPRLERHLLDDSTVVTFVPMRAVDPEGGGLLRPEARAYQEVRKGYTSFLSGDVIMAKITPCMENGKTAVVPTVPGDICFGSTEFHVIRPGPGIAPSWVKRFLLTHDVRRSAQRAMSGAVGQMRVPVSFLESVRVPVAPIAEQGRIADVLDELFSDLDAGVAALERVRDRLKLYRASVLKAAVEGTLTAEWRAEHPHVEPASELLERILVERRRRWEEEQLAKFEAKGQKPPRNWKAKYKEPIKPDSDRLPPLPQGWCWSALAALLHGIEAGKSFMCEPRQARSDEWGVIKVSAMTWGKFNEDENKALPPEGGADPRWEIRKGDILLSRANTVELVGATVLVDECRPRLLLSDKSMRLLYSGFLQSKWLQAVLASATSREQLSNKATGTSDSMRNVSQESVSGILLPLAPLFEQEAIVDLLDDQLSVIEHLESDIDIKLESAQSLRQATLHHAFTGQLVPQDPSDEPASELLKRIAAERQSRNNGARPRPAAPRARPVRQRRRK